MSAISSVMQETRVFPPSEQTVKNATIGGMAAYEALCKEAEQDYAGYWARLAKEHVEWHKPFTQALDESDAPFFKWFTDGEAERLLQLPRPPGRRPASATRSRSSSRRTTARSPRSPTRKCCRRVAKFANALRAQGVKKGDRVIIYLPMSVEGVVAMQACARIGAIHSVVFGGFSAKSLQERIQDAGAVAVITADEQCRGGKNIPLEARRRRRHRHGRLRIDQERHRVQAHRRPLQHGGRARPVVARLSPSQPDTCEPEWVDAEHPLFLLYTSGSTGKPKGVQHSTGGYLLHAILTMKWTFDIKPSDVFWCTADIGWVTGHTYITYGPLACGATEIVFEGVPDLSGRRPLLEDDPGPQGQHLLHRADRDPLADQGVEAADTARGSTTCRRCACSVRWASRSTRKPGCGTTTTSAAAAARSWTPSGRPRPAAT